MRRACVRVLACVLACEARISCNQLASPSAILLEHPWALGRRGRVISLLEGKKKAGWVVHRDRTGQRR